MNYTLHQLQIFTEVVDKQSITKAAEAMHMTQPALSIQLKNFQNQFDLPLTQVVGRRLQITEFGYSIAELAESVLKEADQIKYKTNQFKGLQAGRLRISSASTGKYVIPYLLTEFMHEHPGIDLYLDVTNKTQVMNSLRNSEIDFALVSVVPEDTDVMEEPLLDNELFLMSNSPKRDKKSQLIFREPGSATRKAMDAHFSSTKERKRIELTSNEAVKQAVIAGLGQSILPLIGVKNQIENGDIHIIPVKGLPIVTKWRLIWLKNVKLSPVAQAFIDHIREEKEAIVERHFHWFTHFTPPK
ncbi:MAG: LysR family transcriptional regulator [Flavobacteriia bacterium]|nr:LysR family transcriptional regulator [Flavobacteriia bacterium]